MHKDKFTLSLDESLQLDDWEQFRMDQSLPFQLHSNWPFSCITKKQSNLSEKQTFAQQQNQSQRIKDITPLNVHKQQQTLKRVRPSTQQYHDYFASSSSSNVERKFDEKGQEDVKQRIRKEKQSKQGLYSKNYRDRKKQHLKTLQQQNRFLTKKVQQLHFRLRQLQIQNNRLKKLPNEKEMTIEQLNRQFTQKIPMISEQIQHDIIVTEQDKQPILKCRATIQKQFLEGYDEYGFFGSKKKPLLDYHMNQILEILLRDSQKYFCMLCCKNNDESLKIKLPEFQKINTIFFQIMDMKETDTQRLNGYLKILFPAMKQIKKYCSEMYRNYSKIIQTMDRVHTILKSVYIQNIDFVIKRMKVQTWFAYHKYNKMIRRLKDQWLQMVKNQDNDDQYPDNNTKGYKKSKPQQIMNDE